MVENSFSIMLKRRKVTLKVLIKISCQSRRQHGRVCEPLKHDKEDYHHPGHTHTPFGSFATLEHFQAPCCREGTNSQQSAVSSTNSLDEQLRKRRNHGIVQSKNLLEVGGKLLRWSSWLVSSSTKKDLPHSVKSEKGL